ncbi:phosphotransferase [Cohnella algarum]|uniref:phosphotransferase n=1 Tax=Cohnella algarum TaxID=2044859 RepID=UPI001966D6DE|nr:phosphotransferase [Cohnella algarum]MBN2983842.1 phosphotransferase [Cohnella algarum]
MPVDALLATYFPGGGWKAEAGLAGWNNTTRYVTVGGQRLVLRIYETHRDTGKIAFEHALLAELAKMDTAFRVPVPLAHPSGATFAKLEDGSGRFGCLFRYLEGERPDSANGRTAEAVGETVGELSLNLAAVRIDLPPQYPPYYEMDAAHPSCPQERIAAFCAAPPPAFHGQRAELMLLAERLRQFRAVAPKLRGLPHQLVHGDVNDSNLLAETGRPDRIAAVLDFEFCTRDVRAMEPAVVLSGLLDTEGAADAMTAFADGFRRRVRLLPEEAEAILPLVELRKLDVFVHFLGRRLDGVDGEETLRQQIDSAANGLNSLQRRAGQVIACCRRLVANGA